MSRKTLESTTTYSEGDWFAVPLRDHGCAIGLVARKKVDEHGGIVVGYFFGPRHEALPGPEQVAALTRDAAILVCRCGDLSLIDGSWPIISRTSRWEKSLWPIPSFLSKSPISGRATKVFYADDDIQRIVREEPVNAEEIERLPRDGLFGAGAVEILLTKAIAAK